MSSSPLSPKQEAFALAYLETGNASEAYRRAYEAADMNPASVNREASALLGNPKITTRLEELRAAQQQRHAVTVDRLIGELAAIAFADPGDFFDWGPDGVRVKDKDGLTPQQRRIVSEVSQTVTEAGGTIKVKLHPKLEAIEKLAKHLGMFKELHEHTGKNGEAIEVNLNTATDEFISRISRLAARGRPNGSAEEPH